MNTSPEKKELEFGAVEAATRYALRNLTPLIEQSETISFAELWSVLFNAYMDGWEKKV